jgi:deoxyribodipyrimidine photolyase
MARWRIILVLFVSLAGIWFALPNFFNKKYIQDWIPELSKLDAKHIHAPWEAPKEILEKTDIELGDTYPEPIVDHNKAREKALGIYQEIQ